MRIHSKKEEIKSITPWKALPRVLFVRAGTV